MMSKTKIQPLKPPFTKRLYASLIDYCFVLAYMCFLAGLTGTIYLVTGKLPDWLSYGVGVAEILGFLILVMPVGLYLYFSESSRHHATIGKRALNLIVVSSVQDRFVSGWQIALRTTIKLLPWELAHFFVWRAVALTARHQQSFPVWLEAGLICSVALPCIYMLMIALHPAGRGPHDLLAKTRVIVND